MDDIVFVVASACCTIQMFCLGDITYTGDYAVKSVGVIPEPEVSEFDLADNHKFMILASDGVWEFISSQVGFSRSSSAVRLMANHSLLNIYRTGGS